MAFEVAKQIISNDSGKRIYRSYINKLELEGGIEIDIFKDSEIRTAAKIEFAENYNSLKHVVRFKPNYPAVEHLIMHELVHLDFVIQARKKELNKLFTSNSKHKSDFIKFIEPTILKLRKMGVPESDITNYSTGLFSGINLQVYNTPIDLFIENYLYNEYPELRPYQFISQYNLLKEAVSSVTDSKIIEFSPKDILSKSKIYSIVNSMQFLDLYGIDLIGKFKASPAELKLSKTFYDEYLDYKDDKQPGEEYELVQNWVEDLGLDKYSKLVSEIDFRKDNVRETSPSSTLENFVFGKKEHLLDKEYEMRTFLEKHKKDGTNNDVVIFMVEALKFFESIPDDKIKRIAYEIAVKGTQGFDPNKSNYTIDLIPNKVFTGFQILAYYYVSFALGAPEVLMELGLPYHEEYLLAKTMKNWNN